MVKIGKHNIDKHWFTRGRVIAITVIALLVLACFYYLEKRKYLMKPQVTVAKVKKEMVPVYLDYVSNTVSIRNVEIRARVEGFLDKRNFIEGGDVREGQVLYVIDKRPFEAALLQAKGQLAKDRAALTFALEQVERYKPLAEKDYVSQESYDNYVTQAAELKAAVESDKGAVEQAELNLSWCTMYAPFSGRIGRTLVHVGNLVGAGGQDTKLATLVQLDPIYAYFSPADDELQKILKYMGKAVLKANITLADGTKYPQQGTLDFVDNQVNLDTSTIAMRVTVPNPDDMLLPGIYVDLKLVLDQADALLIPEKALGEDQLGQFVMIVEPNDVVKQSYVTTGATYDEMKAITEGVKEGEMVIVEGLQIVRAGMAVRTQEMEEKGTMRDVIQKAMMGKMVSKKMKK